MSYAKKASEKSSHIKHTNKSSIITSHNTAAQQPISYASGLTSKARDAVRSLITGTDRESPYRISARKPSLNVKVPKKDHTLESRKEFQHQSAENGQDRGFEPAFDPTDHDLYKPGSPLEAHSGTRTHRGYSLLNQPVAIESINSSVVGDGESGEQGPQKQVTAQSLTSHRQSKAVYNEVNYFKVGQICPEILFLGYSVQTGFPKTVDEAKERRKRRQERGTERTKRGIEYHNVDGKQEVSSQNQTSITDQKKASIKFKMSSALDSLAFKTQSPGQTFAPHERNADGTISSVNTGLQNQLIQEVNGWQPFQTQSMSIPNPTIEAIGERTFQSNPDQQRNGDSTIENGAAANEDTFEANSNRLINEQQILATSSIESHGNQKSPPRITAVAPRVVSSLKSKQQKAQPYKDRQSQQKTLAQQSKSPAPVSVVKKESPQKKPNNVSPSKGRVPSDQRPQPQARTSGKSKLQVKSTSPPKGGRASPMKSSGRDFSQKQSNASLLRAQGGAGGSASNAAQFQMPSKNRVSQNWQNSSQDKIRRGSKQAPPVTPGLKRFKTQTRDGKKIDESGSNNENGTLQLSNQKAGPAEAKAEDGVESSSFAEDLSYNQGKIEVLSVEVGSNAKKQSGRIHQNLALLHNLSVNEDGKGSEAGLKELSVVESDNSAQGLETPATALRGNKQGGFLDLHQVHQNASNRDTTQDQIREASAEATPINLQPKPQIKVQDEDESNANSPATNRAKDDAKEFNQPATKETSDHLKPVAYGAKRQSKVSYLSSNESVILAQSQQTSPIVTANETLQSHLLGQAQAASQVKKRQRTNITSQTGQLRVFKQTTESTTGDRKQSSEVREKEGFSSKRLSSNPGPAFKRSQTKDERGQSGIKTKQLSSAGLINDRVSNQNRASRRVVKNMPLHDNSRAKQNQVRQTNHFVDSDFFDSHSIQRTPKPPGIKARMGSTSPVSSQATGFMRQPSVRTRRSQIQDGRGGDGADTNNKSSLLDVSDLTYQDQQNSSIKLKKPKEKKKLHSLERENPKKYQMTDSIVKDNQSRTLGRMYQKKFIERREKQVQIINKQLSKDASDTESKNLAYALKQQDSSQFDHSLLDQKAALLHQRALTKQAGLETLRKVHDSLGYTKVAKDHSRRRHMTNRSSWKPSWDHTQKVKNITDIHRSFNSSIDENYGTDRFLGLPHPDPQLTNSYNSLAQNEIQIAQQMSSNRFAQQSVNSNTTPSNFWSQPIDQGVANGEASQQQERGGQKLTSDDSTMRKTNLDSATDEQQFAYNYKRITMSQSPQNKPVKKIKELSKVQQTMKQFKMPKMRQPRNWQNIVERKYNMVQIEDETYFIPGRASRAVYQTTANTQTANISVQPRKRQANQLERSKNNDTQIGSESPRGHGKDDNGGTAHFSQMIADRKKSHELSSIRNQYSTDEGRIKKLTNFSISKKIEKQRQQLQISGRDDPANVLGYQKLNTGHPSTMRSNARRRNQLDPLNGEGSVSNRVDLASGSDDKMQNAVQKNIAGMLSDLNRAKTMRIANQVLKEQQQQMYALQQRRDQINSQGNQQLEARQQQHLLGNSTQNRPNLQIQSIPAMMMMSNSVSTVSGSIKDQKQAQHHIQPSQGKAFMPWPQSSATKNIVATPTQQSVYASCGILASSQESVNSPSMHGSPLKSGAINQIVSGVSGGKPPTPLANTGLRIIQTNNTTTSMAKS